MNQLDAVKIGVNIVVCAGVSKIVHGVIANNVPAPEKVVEKATIGAAAVVAGMMAKDASRKYVSTKIDSYVVSYKKIKNRVTEVKEQKEDQ